MSVAAAPAAANPAIEAVCTPHGWDEALATALGMPPPVKRDAGPSAAADLGP